MKEFRTIFDIHESEIKINYDSNLIFMGSCFSDNIGKKIKELKFPVLINPFGVLYNPVSIANSIDNIINNTKFSEQDLHFFNNKWFSFYHHSDFSGKDKTECLSRINNSTELAHQRLRNADFLFLTFGTSRVYLHKKTAEIVSNCHKLPEKEFSRKLLEINEIVETIEQMTSKLFAFNPSLNIVFTLSPVRHWKDGAIGNMQSKARLLIAIDKITSSINNCSYFPSYEIVMDDLRDYRFYAGDMIHLSNTAVDYIFSKFSEVYIDNSTNGVQHKILKIIRARNHRPFNPDLPEYKMFAEKSLDEINTINNKYHNIDLTEEREFFTRIIEKFNK